MWGAIDQFYKQSPQVCAVRVLAGPADHFTNQRLELLA